MIRRAPKRQLSQRLALGTLLLSLTGLFSLSGCLSTPEAVAPEVPTTAPGPEWEQVIVPDDANPELDPIAPPIVEVEAEPIEISFTLVGDMTYGSNGKVSDSQVASILEGVRAELVGADITMGNLETALGTGPTTKCGGISANCADFQAPPYAAKVMADAGFDVVSAANNHSNDAGPRGVASTDEALTGAGIVWTGRRDQITYLEREGVTVGFLGFAPYDSVANALDMPKVLEMVREAATNADLVVVMPHLGAEGEDKMHVRPGVETAYGENRGDSMAFARAVIDAGADLVVISGPHVLRGMEWYNGRLIAYSMGNFSGYNTLSMSGKRGISGILNVTLTQDGEFVGGNLVPLAISSVGIPAVDSQGRGIKMVQSLSKEDFGVGGISMTDDGHILPPTVEQGATQISVLDPIMELWNYPPKSGS